MNFWHFSVQIYVETFQLRVESISPPDTRQKAQKLRVRRNPLQPSAETSEENNMRYLALVATVLFLPGWTVTHERDRMTDKTLTWASAVSGGATLLVGCLNGSVQPRLTFAGRIGYGQPGVVYRVDDGAVVPRTGLVSEDGTVLYVWVSEPGAAVVALRKAKRLRVSVASALFDFDLTAGEKIPVKWTC